MIKKILDALVTLCLIVLMLVIAWEAYKMEHKPDLIMQVQCLTESVQDTLAIDYKIEGITIKMVQQ